MATTQSFSGHSDAEFVAYYSHASDESRKRAMENLYKPEKNKENRVEQSQTLFDRVQNKEVDFAEFFEAITGEKFEAWGKKRTHSFEQTA